MVGGVEPPAGAFSVGGKGEEKRVLLRGDQARALGSTEPLFVLSGAGDDADVVSGAAGRPRDVEVPKLELDLLVMWSLGGEALINDVLLLDTYLGQRDTPHVWSDTGDGDRCLHTLYPAGEIEGHGTGILIQLVNPRQSFHSSSFSAQLNL